MTQFPLTRMLRLKNLLARLIRLTLTQGLCIGFKNKVCPKEICEKSVIAIVKIYCLLVYYYHVMYVFQSESTLNGCLIVKEPLARDRRE